jgi:hypothetical protein
VDASGLILTANKPWLQACGFDIHEVVGKTLRIIQGPSTDMAVVASLMEAAHERRSMAVELINYTKNKMPVRNRLVMEPYGQYHFFCTSEISVAWAVAMQENKAGLLGSAQEWRY